MTRPSPRRTVLWLLLLVVAYVVTGRIGLTLAYYNRMATLLWAPSGIAVAAVWLGGRRMLPGVVVGSFLTNLWIGATPLLALAISLGNTSEALVADMLVERAGLRRGLHSVRDVMLFVGLIVATPTIVAAANAAFWLPVLAHLPLERVLPTALTWWLGDAGGVLVVTPLLLVFATPRVERIGGATEGLLLAVLAPAIASFSFGLVLPGAAGSVTLALLPFPLLMWAALRFGFRGATLTTGIVTIAAVVSTMAGSGPFRTGNPHVDVANLWSLLAALSITALLLAAALEEREREAMVRRDRERWLKVAVAAAEAVAIERDLAHGRVRIPRDDDAEWLDAEAFNSSIDPADRGALDRAITDSSEAWECEYRIVDERGTRTMREHARVVERDATGRPTRSVGLRRDITVQRREEQERLALQRELEASKRLSELGLLAGGIAHDFNNLLVVVRANAELVRVGQGRYTTEALSAIDKAVVRAAELTDQLLSYAGRRPVRRRAVDLGELASETVRLLRPSVPSRVTINVESDAQSPLVEGDPTQLRQLVMNLALNAVQAIDGEGRVVLRVAAAPDQRLLLEVRDNGRGMDEETRARVFQPFFTTKEHGRGLGMPAVFGIVRTHQGTVEITSAPGEGTSVAVLLPASDRPARPVPSEPRPAPSLRARRRVFVIDGDDETRANVRRQLAEAGWEVTVAGGQAEARARMSDSGPFEVALVGAEVVDAHGAPLHLELRAGHPELPMVLMTDRDAPALAVPVLRKPFADVDLLARLHDALAVAPPLARSEDATAAE